MPASAVDPDYVGTYPDFVGTHPKPLRVTVVTTITRDGGRVRTSRLAGSTDDGPWTYLERLAAVPTTDPHALLLLPTGNAPRLRGDRPRRRHRRAADRVTVTCATAPRSTRAWPR